MIQELQESQESKVLTLTNRRFPTRTFPINPTGPKEQQGAPLVLTGHQLPSELFDLKAMEVWAGPGPPRVAAGDPGDFLSPICRFLLPSAIRLV